MNQGNWLLALVTGALAIGCFAILVLIEMRSEGESVCTAIFFTLLLIVPTLFWHFAKKDGK